MTYAELLAQMKPGDMARSRLWDRYYSIYMDVDSKVYLEDTRVPSWRPEYTPSAYGVNDSVYQLLNGDS